MRFRYDSTKAASNLKKHRVSFADAEGVFYDPLGIHQLDPDSEDEERFVAIGMGSAGQLLVVVYYASWRRNPAHIGSPRYAT